MTQETHLLTPRLQSSAQPHVSQPQKSGTSQEKCCKLAIKVLSSRKSQKSSQKVPKKVVFLKKVLKRNKCAQKSAQKR